jgi:CDGSH-type Zn-finger protein/truncated hemoglobin YjbI/ferredoxin
VTSEHVDPAPSITVSINGPYRVSNDVPIVDHLGRAIEVPPPASFTGTALCRCGASANKPFCDSSHLRIDFDGDKQPDRVADRRDRHAGVSADVLDNRGLCAHAGLCTDIVLEAFHTDSEPFATPNGARLDDLIAAARRCPSGALSVALGDHELRSAVDWDRDATVVVSRDGPYWVRGGIDVLDDEGEPVGRNEGGSLEHCALCRCGQSKNKPFCSGMHWTVGFSDPPEPEHPSIFEWAGGLPALTQVLRLFYGKYIPDDDLLRPVFLHMSTDHPERVAAWLGEVFGGPKAYSESMGGYTAMVSHHLGRALDEPKRRRWVELLIRAADEVGLSNNAEFRSAFVAYLEWGTRLAVENSRAGATPPSNMPMPHWDWNTAAGPPSARDRSDDAALPDPDVPAPDEAIDFDTHVKPLFRERDRNSMQWAFDLWSPDDVREHAVKILMRVSNGSMPPDAPWNETRVEIFRRWVAENTDSTDRT